MLEVVLGMSNSEGRVIQVVPYDPNWPKMFEVEAELIRERMGENCISIHHIGSTSVADLPAKPVIDMLVVVKDIRKVDQANQLMEEIGYEAKGENGMAFRRFFQKGNPVRTHHIHAYEEGDPEIDRYLKFRNWLRMHKEDAEKYASLKKELAARFPSDILKYVSGKSAFVEGIDEKDGFDGWRIVQALTEQEFAAVRSLSGNQMPLIGINHIHFVFYKVAKIIGYAHLKLCENHEAVIEMLKIDHRYFSQAIESQFYKQCERWLTHQGYTNKTRE